MHQKENPRPGETASHHPNTYHDSVANSLEPPPTVSTSHSMPDLTLHPFRPLSGDACSHENPSTELGAASNNESKDLDCLDATLVGQKLEGKCLGDGSLYSEFDSRSVPAPTVEWRGSSVSETNSSRSFGDSAFAEGEPITDTNHLRVPLNDKLWLVSPPGSPPIGWTSTFEHPPNSIAFPEDLMDALADWVPDSFELGEPLSSKSSIPRFPNTSFAFSKGCAPFEKGDNGNYPLIVIEDWSA